jgi:hypothetical protein
VDGGGIQRLAKGSSNSPYRPAWIALEFPGRVEAANLHQLEGFRLA